jgi:predicted nucleic acid-binding protein
MRAAGLQPMRIVMDTNVFVAALRSGGGASRQVLASCAGRTSRS